MVDFDFLMKTIGINSECIEYGHPKRAELPDVNINMGAQSFNTDRASLTVSRAARLYFMWCAVTLFVLYYFQGLVFRRGTHQLFSASHDRTVKIWNLDEMAYVETL